MMLTVCDIFAGAGGSSSGAASVPGVEVKIAANHWQLAVDVHAENHQETEHACVDLHLEDPRNFPRTDILWASPECFTAGHLVTTRRGQVPIELVEVGDVVLTHKSRWREVVRVQASESKDVVVVKGQGHPGITTTASHRFWAKPSDLAWRNDIRQYRRNYGQPDWVQARDLANSKALWSTPIRVDAESAPDLPPVFVDSDHGWWLLGRWLGDGSLSFGRNHEVTITCGFHEAAELGALLAGTGVRWHRSDKRTAAVFTASCVESRDWLLEHCGHGSASKQTPAWTLMLGEVERRAILHGYMSADGYVSELHHRASTVSRALAITIRLLAESLGHRVSMAYDKRTTYSIEGRTGFAKRQWIMMWPRQISDKRTPEAHADINHAWSRVRSVTPVPGVHTVYNIEVAEDHSYVLDGIVVKNCTKWSIANSQARALSVEMGGDPSLFDDVPDELISEGEDEISRSRLLMFDVLRFVEHHRYRAVVVENVVDIATQAKYAAAWTAWQRHQRQEEGTRGMSYADFIAAKRNRAHRSGIDIDLDELPPQLHDWQAEIVQWACRVGRAAIWADTGLGKTFMQTAWVERVSAGGVGLILAPLAVCHQTVREAAKLGITATYVRDGADMDRGIYVTNYEMLDHFDPETIDAVVLDEASILKQSDGKTRAKLIAWAESVPYRLACTATPAPNDPEELTNQAEFLGHMSRSHMLAAYFVHDDEGWRLKGHARRPMMQWMATWAVALRKPSDIGYDDTGYDLPGLEIISELVEVDIESEGQLFATDLGGVGGRAKVRRESLDARVARAVEIVKAEPDEPWLIWCGLNDEANAVAAALDATNVHGGLSPDDKAAALLSFADGTTLRLVTKPSLASFGLNWQHCARMVFVGLSDSYEAYYQAIRRCYRYGQTRVVKAHVVLSELESQIATNVARKEREATHITAALVAEMRRVRDLETA